MYLDTDRLQDYLSSLDPGIVEEFEETITETAGRRGSAGLRAHILNVGGEAHTQDESVTKATIRVRAQNLFHRVYDELNGSNLIHAFDEDDVIDVSALKKGDVVEVSRTFSPSPLNRMIDQVFGLIDLMRGLGLTEQLADQEAEQAISALTMIFRNDQEDTEVPMVARSDGQDASVVFTAKPAFILAGEDDFAGEMTVFGRIHRKTPAASSVDLFDLLRMPRGLQRVGGSTAQLRDTILDLFESWPKELGGPLDKEAIKVPGPALTVTPLAVYT